MEQPVKQISGVVRDLCQGSAKEQTAAVKNYFLPEASFLHPFCWVPSFSNVNVPLIGAVNSRVFIQAIFRWYRLLSPKVDLEIHSSVFDQRTNLLYLSMKQTFRIWFIPFYSAPVQLVTVLHLVSRPIGADGQPLTGAATSTEDNTAIAPGRGHRYFIQRQEDLYQVNEFLRFVVPGIGPATWKAWQIASTLLCALGVMVLLPFIAIFARIAGGRKVKQ